MKFKINYFKIIGLLLMPLIYGCSTGTIDPDEIDERKIYFPDDEGLFRIYEIQQIDYKANGERDTSRYRLKEKVSQRTSAQETFQVLERYRFQNNDWALDSIWNIFYNPTNVVLYQNNIPLVKIATPVNKQTSWDRNSYNSRDEMISNYIDIKSDTVIAQNNYSQVAIVELENITDPIIGNNVSYEVYSPGIGLVSKYVENIDYKQGVDLGKQIISQGVIYKQVLVISDYE
ncbi:hypothetical protein OO013_09400 [Mangrovivirga sp. M17]|uniref:Uncharacterized protein n=1 Tax=Mangrovivirga halotolerans TaxID=2993936 RepID=A0ABT3RQL7_9BACT|nr:hypothetical protein [Mangrovivirga halotolerans]MCX2744080.1 hypothetical protein [Mangrovivirga halotolerans]